MPAISYRPRVMPGDSSFSASGHKGSRMSTDTRVWVCVEGAGRGEGCPSGWGSRNQDEHDLGRDLGGRKCSSGGNTRDTQCFQPRLRALRLNGEESNPRPPSLSGPQFSRVFSGATLHRTEMRTGGNVEEAAPKQGRRPTEINSWPGEGVLRQPRDAQICQGRKICVWQCSHPAAGGAVTPGSRHTRVGLQRDFE